MTISRADGWMVGWIAEWMDEQTIRSPLALFPSTSILRNVLCSDLALAITQVFIFPFPVPSSPTFVRLWGAISKSGSGPISLGTEAGSVMSKIAYLIQA